MILDYENENSLLFLSNGDKRFLINDIDLSMKYKQDIRLQHEIYSKSSHRKCSVKKGVLRNFAKFTGKHLCQSQLY